MIDLFLRLTSPLSSPEIFRKWTAISVVSAATQRKVFFRFNGSVGFLNLYVALLGGPGVGKTQAINAGRDLCALVPTIYFAANMGSKEKFLHTMAKLIKPVQEAAPDLVFQCAAAGFIPELGIFIRPKDIEMLNVLLDLYDCRNFRYETLSRDPVFIENPVFTLLGGTTPSAFAENIARPYAGTGILSRLNMIYSNEAKIPDVFGSAVEIPYRSALPELKRIHSLFGELQFDGPARTFIQRLVNAGIPPVPTDARLAEYLPRRAFHLMKLCGIISVARDSSLIVTRADAEEALALLLESEALLPNVISQFGGSPALQTVRGLETWITGEFAKSRKGITEQNLRRKLLEEVPPQYVNSTISELIQSGMIRMESVGTTRVFYPG